MDSPSAGPLTNPYDKIRRSVRRRLTEGLLDHARETEGDERQQILDHVVLVNMGVARSIASRYRSRGIAQEDLEQVAYAALVRAVHRFDLDAESNLLAYLVPSIRGELRRHFRDLGWAIRPPRRIQELQSLVVQERDNLPHAVTERDVRHVLAERLDVSEAEVAEALAAQGCFAPASLDVPMNESGGDGMGVMIPDPRTDDAQEAAETRAMLEPAIRHLSARDRELVRLRFYEELSQSEIADALGVTQAQVSRLITRLLRELRESMGPCTPA